MKNAEFNKLFNIIEKLRDPKEGCPWDLKQTHESLLKYLIEESYEFVDAVKNAPNDMEEELGDVLLQVLLHCQISSEDGGFDFESLCQKLSQKMMRRHPHVFDQKVDRALLTDEHLQNNWDEIKRKEGKNKIHPHKFSRDYLIGPSLTSAYKIGKKTSLMNFDWENAKQVLYKVEEEWQELKAEIPHEGKGNHQAIKEELGDLFFSLAQLSRHLGIDPEECLREGNEKFLKRFNKMVDSVEDDQKELTQLSQEQLEKYWQKIKTYD